MEPNEPTPTPPGRGAPARPGGPTEHVRAMLEFMEGVLNDLGPRESASQAERDLARRLVTEWGRYCESVVTQAISCAPRAFFGVIPLAVVAYYLAVGAYFLFPPLAAVLVGAAVVALYLHLGRAHLVLAPLFPRSEGWNVLGRIPPSGEAVRRVVLSAHLDSAWECNLWYHFKGAAIPLQVVCVLSFLLLLGSSLAASVAWFLGVTSPIFTTLGIVCAALYGVVGLFTFFHSGVPVPGAMDNLSGVAVLGGLGRLLAMERPGGGFFPASTEVWLVAFSSEEAGLQGSQRFMVHNREELDRLPTWFVNLDSLADEHDLTVLSGEVFNGTRNDPELVALALDVAAASGLPARKHRLLMGMTDAASATKAGYSAITVLCQDVTRLIPSYHTRLDTLDRVRPEALAVTLKMVLELVRRVDGGAMGDGSGATGSSRPGGGREG